MDLDKLQKELDAVQAQLEELWAEQRAEDVVKATRREKLIAAKKVRQQIEARMHALRTLGPDAVKALFASAGVVDLKSEALAAK